MSKLIPVIYRNMKYPSHIEANIHEVSGNFYKEKLIVKSPYSLHTECSHGPRVFSSKIVNELVHIKEAQKDKIPQLWRNKKWANDFFLFIDHLISSNYSPEVLEIHPPFSDYCGSFDQFLDIFRVFYYKFIKKYPTTTILIENRFGTRNKDGKFLLSTCSDVLSFCRILSELEKNNLRKKFKIVLDYPQLFSAETDRGKYHFGPHSSQIFENIISFNQDLKKYKEIIGGFHMWGKLKTENGCIPHAGNLDTLFSNSNKLKHMFLSSVFSTFNDGIERYFVPEVNSGENDLHSIVSDMEQAGFIFLSKNCYMSDAKKKIFNGCFNWPGIKIPEKNLDYRKSGFIEKDGWEIKFSFGKKDGKEYMNFCCDHGMTNTRYGRIYDDGTSEELVDLLDSYDPNTPEGKKEGEYIKKLNEIKKSLGM